MAKKAHERVVHARYSLIDSIRVLLMLHAALVDAHAKPIGLFDDGMRNAMIIVAVDYDVVR